MQIFILDDNFRDSASCYFNKHVVKIPVEIAQVLSTVLREKGYQGDDIYKSVNKSIWIKWVLSDDNNFWFLVDYCFALLREYNYRYEKHHKTNYTIKRIFEIGNKILSVKYFDYKKPVHIPLVMSDKYKIENNVIESYRTYYRKGKRHLAFWKNRDKPEWWI